MNSYEDVIKDIEMVADDLYDMANGNDVTAGGYRSMATVLRMAVLKVNELIIDYKAMDEHNSRLAWNKDKSAIPPYKDVLLMLSPSKLDKAYCLVGQLESSTGTYVRAIDKEPILDQIIAWKEIN